MGRHAEGWKLVWRRGIAHVRFRHQKSRVDRTTGERDEGKAATRAADIYARWLRGAPTPRRKVSASNLSLDDLFLEWIESLRGVLEPRTIEGYEIYGAHLIAFFRDLDAISTGTAREYSQARLKKVQRKTLRKELSALRSFLAWADENHYVKDVPHIPTPPRTAVGTVAIERKAEPVEISEAQAERILKALPEWSRRIEGKRIPIRAFVRVLWETGLRPATVHRLEVGKHWKPGWKYLEIEARIDKVRYARKLPITPAAVKGIATAWDNGKRGAFPFGRVGAIRTDYRKTLRRAAKRCRIPGAEKISLYDFRHGRLSDVVEKTADLRGAAYMAGHKQLTTTNRYVRPRETAGARVVKAISKPKTAKRKNSGSEWVSRRKR